MSYDHTLGIDTLGKVLPFQMKHGGVADNVSGANLLIFWSAIERDSGLTLWTRRDVTTVAKASGYSGGAAVGRIGLPTYDGRTLPGPATAAVTVTNGKVNVTHPATTNAYRQRLYMSKAGTASPLYLAAEWDNGAAVAGIEIGSGTSLPNFQLSIADASLFETVPTVNRSQTESHAALADPVAAPTVVDVPGGAAGQITNGTHVFKIVDVSHWDTWKRRVIAHWWEVFNRDTGEPERWPKGGAFFTLGVGV